MPISERLAQAKPNESNRGCRTCLWMETLSEKDRAAFYEWIDSGNSLTQLFRICVDDPDNPYPVSFTALRNHVRDCR